MSLSRFNVIVATDSGNGIARNGGMPWDDQSDMKFFRDQTIGKGNNAVIMGRVTYETIPQECRPLKNRYNIVISRTWKQEDHPEVSIFNCIEDALMNVSTTKKCDEVYVAGGEQLYEEVLSRYMYLCDKIYITRFKKDYDCDQFFNWDLVKDIKQAHDPSKFRQYSRYVFNPSQDSNTHKHQEYQYLNHLKTIMNDGEIRTNRTSIQTKSLFGQTQMRFDISNSIPLLTTRKLFFEGCLKELLFFISGKTDTKILENQGVKYWKGNTSRDFLDSRGLKWEEGVMGPGYSHQWRHFNAEYDGHETDYTKQGYDQLVNVIESIKTDPFSRRHIVSAWNPCQLDEMALPPCHVLFQFNVSADKQYLDCMLLQRSGDMFLGVPYNIFMYSVLTYMVAHLTNLKPRYFYHTINDAHIYANHFDQVRKVLRRTPKPFPKLQFRGLHKIHDIDDFSIENFIIMDYSHWQHVKADMVV